MNNYVASCQNICAIGIGKLSDPRFLVYISVYGQKPGYYYFECEISVTSGNYQVIDRGEKVDFSSLVLIIKEHIDLHSVIQPQPA